MYRHVKTLPKPISLLRAPQISISIDTKTQQRRSHFMRNLFSGAAASRSTINTRINVNRREFVIISNRNLSTNRDIDTDIDSDNEETNKPKPITLRRLASPFLQLCHPDKFAHIASAQKVNLNAVQTLNELIDSCENLSNKKTNNSMGSNKIKHRYSIEFMVPSAAPQQSSLNSLKRTNKNNATCTRREVVLTFGNGSWNNGNRNGMLSQKQIHDLQRRVRSQIRKLIRVAGLTPPKEDYPEEEHENDESASNSAREQLWDELGIGERRYGKRRARVRWEKSQQRFVRSIDWNERKEKYERAVRRMKEDIATFHLTDENRKRQIIAEVVSRIRFSNQNEDLSSNESIAYEDQQYEDDEDENIITPLDQLIAIRRISLLFMEHFDKFDVEMHGRIWEKLVIVLNNDENNSLAKRKKISKYGGESGFKFSVGGDDDERIITATVPIDFLDDEIVREFKKNMEDLYVIDEADFDYA